MLVVSLSNWVFFFWLGLVLPLQNSVLFFSLGLLLLSGLLYNIKPFRFKDKPYLDFIFEALNNPIRLLVGWYSAVAPDKLIPSSFLLAFWSIGIFLMASKRFGELRFINDVVLSSKYRRSFTYYTEENLLLSMVASISSFNYMFGALSFKYSIDLVLMLPLLVIWILWFFKLSYETDSIVKDPERVFEKKSFLLYSILIMGIFIYLLFTGNTIMGFIK